MEHLSLEALARLIDESPSREEGTHLATCGRCRAELDAVVEQTRSLGALPPREAPAGQWDGIEARLRLEGLIGETASSAPSLVIHEGLVTRGGVVTRGDPGRRSRRWLRMAATVVPFVIGAATGWSLRGPAPETGGGAGSGGASSGQVAAAADADARDPDASSPEPLGARSAGAGSSAPNGPMIAAAIGGGVAATGGGVGANGGGVGVTSVAPPQTSDAPSRVPTAIPPRGSLAEAAELVQMTEDLYVEALLKYGIQLENVGIRAAGDPIGRYFALEGVLAVTREAVRNAPADPFLNGLMINTIAEREATLHRISLGGAGIP